MFQTNGYVVRVPGDPACWIIDPGFDPDELIEHIRAQGLEPQAVLLTHSHCDHIGGLHEVRAAFPDVPILIHAAERDWLTEPMKNLSGAFGFPFFAPEATGTLEHGQTLELAGTTWRVAHTPGHSPGSVSFIHEPSKQAIVGDTLFAGSIGRTDFPGSSFEQLERSIRQEFYTLDDDTRVFPGHGPPTTIGRERKANPYVRD